MLVLGLGFSNLSLLTSVLLDSATTTCTFTSHISHAHCARNTLYQCIYTRQYGPSVDYNVLEVNIPYTREDGQQYWSPFAYQESIEGNSAPKVLCTDPDL